MARNYTTNLNLVKPDKTDQYNVADFNDNMDKIDNFAGLVPARALTADKLTTARNINGVAFDGSQNIINGLWFYSSTETYNQNYIVYNVEDSIIKMYRSLVNNNLGNPLTDETKWEEISLGGSGLEVLDIGIAPCGIDETENKRRYLNGQVIMQDQFSVFTSKLKARVGWNAESETATLRPNLVKTETEWQTIKASSDYNQVGAFVIDDDAGTIRLPAVVNIMGLFDLQNAGLTVAAGLPNITGTVDAADLDNNSGGGATGAFQVAGDSIGGVSIGTVPIERRVNFDASRSSDIYGNSDTVQVESIQYPYFIQVATGAEYEEPVINEYTVTSAYSYGMSQYYPGIMNNNSWLRSNGQWNSGDVYVGLYNWILEQVNSGVEGFKGTGYAYQTSDNSLTYWITSQTPAVGQCVYGGNPMVKYGEIASLVTDGFVFVDNTATQRTVTRANSYDVQITDTTNWINDYDYVINMTNQTFRLPLLDGSENLLSSKINGNLYYYCGNVEQNTQLVNVARIEEKLVDKTDWGQAASASMPSNQYIDLTLGASGTSYTAPADGWFYIEKLSNASNQYIAIVSSTLNIGKALSFSTNNNATMYVGAPVFKNEIITVSYNLGGTNIKFRFYYSIGETK